MQKVSQTAVFFNTFRLAFAVGPDKSIRRTATNDSSDGVAVLDATGLGGMARLVATRITALVVNASVARLTVAVHSTLGLHGLNG